MSGARVLAVAIGAALFVIGLVFGIASRGALHFPWVPSLLLGTLIVITAVAEPVYGALVRRPPLYGNWRPTGEKFVDPASGKPVEVWFDEASGERKYVDVGERKH